MTQSKKNKELITRKAIILDACLLIEILHNQVFFNQLIDFLRDDLKAIPLRIAPVYIECVNGLPRDQKIEGCKTENKSNFDRLMYGVDFIEKITKEVEIRIDKVDVAKMLANLHAFAVASGKYDDCFKKTVSNPSYVDYLLGAMSFHKDTVIATIDHKDFPLFLYDRLYLKTFDLNNDIFTVGFYKINENKYSSLIDLASKIIKKQKNKENKSNKKY